MSSISRPCPAPRKSPSGPTNLSAFHSAGLWLAVMAMPPCAPCRRTINWTVGTGQTPTSRTPHPLESRPATTDCLTISPEVRVSRPMTMVPEPTYVPNACAKRTSSWGVKLSARARVVFGLDDDADHGLGVRRADVRPAFGERDLDAVGQVAVQPVAL